MELRSSDRGTRSWGQQGTRAGSQQGPQNLEANRGTIDRGLLVEEAAMDTGAIRIKQRYKKHRPQG